MATDNFFFLSILLTHFIFNKFYPNRTINRIYRIYELKLQKSNVSAILLGSLNVTNIFDDNLVAHM